MNANSPLTFWGGHLLIVVSTVSMSVKLFKSELFDYKILGIYVNMY